MVHCCYHIQLPRFLPPESNTLQTSTSHWTFSELPRYLGNSTATMPGTQRKPIHDQPRLCDYILGRISEPGAALRVGPSSIPGAGSGLFAINDIPSGSDIFRSQPILVICESAQDGICDWCLLNRNSSVHPDGRFYTSDDKKPGIAPCSGCKVAQYCLKVNQVPMDHRDHILLMY